MGVIERWALRNILNKRGQCVDIRTTRCCPQRVLAGVRWNLMIKPVSNYSDDDFVFSS